ncbi:unnamed protein product, partial [Cyprideis torosa]
MNSEVEKEPSDFEAPRADDGFALPKFDGVEVLNDLKEFSESGETAPRTDVLPRCNDNDNKTSGLPDQMEVSEDEGTVRKGNNSRVGVRPRSAPLQTHDRSAPHRSTPVTPLHPAPFHFTVA